MFTRELSSFGVIYHQHIDASNGLLELFIPPLNPKIHGIHCHKLGFFYLVQHTQLQAWFDITQCNHIRFFGHIG